MGQPVSTTSPGMKQSAQIMHATEEDIIKIMNRVMGEVVAMPYVAGSKEEFTAAMERWKIEAEKITKDLTAMATRLNGGADLIFNTELDNAQAGKFF